MQILKQLEQAYAKDQTPDGVVKLIADPLMKFIWVREITSEQFENLKGRRICFRNRSGTWDGGEGRNEVPSYFLGVSYICNTYARFFELSERWAIIGYEHRLDPNLGWPPCNS